MPSSPMKGHDHRRCTKVSMEHCVQRHRNLHHLALSYETIRINYRHVDGSSIFKSPYGLVVAVGGLVRSEARDGLVLTSILA